MNLALMSASNHLMSRLPLPIHSLGRVQAVELRAALALPLAAYLIGPRQQDGEAFLEVNALWSVTGGKRRKYRSRLRQVRNLFRALQARQLPERLPIVPVQRGQPG